MSLRILVCASVYLCVFTSLALVQDDIFTFHCYLEVLLMWKFPLDIVYLSGDTNVVVVKCSGKHIGTMSRASV